MKHSVLLVLALLASGAATGKTAPRRSVLPLTVNGVEQGEAWALLDGEDVLLRVADLEQAGVHGFAGARRELDGQAVVSLSSLAPSVAYELDRVELRLRLVVEPRFLARTGLDLGGARPAGIVYSKDSSAFLNYSATVLSSGAVNGFGEAGWSVHGNLLYGSVSRRANGTYVRGLTNFTVDDREKLNRWVIGDSFAQAGGGLSGSTFLAGVSVSKNFDLDPYFYRYPGVGVSGAVLTPTTAEIYVNGALVRKETLAPGAFDLTSLPVQAGSGDTRVVLRDAFGQEHVLSAPYYLSTRLLAPGLSEYSYNLGLQREDFAGQSFRYGGPVFLGTHRLGLTSVLTAGLRAEASREVVSGGPTLAVNLGTGQLELSGAASRASGLAGWGGSVGYTYSSRAFGAGALVRTMSGGYATVSLARADDRALLEASVFSSANLGRLGSLSLQYSRLAYRDKGTANRVSASASARLAGRANLFLSASRQYLADGRTANEAFVGVSWFLGGTATANVSLRHDDTGSTFSLDAQQSLPKGEGFGYRVHGDVGSAPAAASGRAQYQGPFGLYEASYDRTSGGGTGSLTVSGGLVAIGGALALSRPVQNGFALIRVPGVGGVRGFSSNQDMGRTNRGGDLLVPDLLPYYGNVLGIADDDVPMGYEVAGVRKVIAPPYRGGALVSFPVRRLHAFRGSIRLVLRGRELVPAYGALRVTAGGVDYESSIGGRGEFYMENVPPGSHPAVVLYRGVTCALNVVMPDSAEPIVKLGALSCVSDAAPPLERGVPDASRKPLPAVLVTAAAPASAAPRTRASAATIVYAVHISSFRKRETAERDAARLAKDLGRPSHTVPVDLGPKGTWYRALVGDFETVEQALRYRAELLHRMPGEVGSVYRLAEGVS